MASSQDVLDGLLRRLASPSPVVAQQAVLGVFSTLRQGAAKGVAALAPGSSTRTGAISACLSRPSKVQEKCNLPPQRSRGGVAAGGRAACIVPCRNTGSNNLRTAAMQAVVQEAVDQLLALVQAGGEARCLAVHTTHVCRQA